MADFQKQGESGSLSVSAAMAMAKGALESVAVTILGEVSEVSVKPGYKAAYFTIKDSGAALPCMMWNNRYNASGVELVVGQLVEVTGRFTLYAAKGRMNFDVFSLSLSGEGALRMQVAEIARRMKAAGLTDPARKRPIPEFPERIGLVTSPRSAAVHDVLRTLRRRFPVADVLLAGVPVEGATAAAGIVDGMKCVVDAGAQVVLVVRGGGSFEDLMPFNDERLARTIAACPVPVITGIGHEVDTSIADMVSDLRASTPTAAAEAVSPAPDALAATLQARAASMVQSSSRSLERLQASLRRVQDRPMFGDPLLLFASEALALDAAADRIARVLPARLERDALAVGGLQGRLAGIGGSMTQRFEYQMRSGAARLADLSPLNVLARGYSITRTAAGEIVREVSQVHRGSSVEVTLVDGKLFCEVKSSETK